MKRSYSAAWLLCLMLICPLYFTKGEPIMLTAFGIAGVSGIFLSYHALTCYWKECCGDSWFKQDLDALKGNLTAKLYGQHFVDEIVVPAIRSHLFAVKPPKKALTLSFHGWTGTGKNYVSKMIAEALYREGMQSRFVHHFMATHHFPHTDMVRTYQNQLREWISTNVSACERSLFIFDEIDKMPPGLIDAIKPYIDHNDYVDKVSYKRTIFIFLSNTGGVDINAKTLEFYLSGTRRKDIPLKDMEDRIHLGAFNEMGGYQGASIIDRNLIDHYVPFLPLQRQHVKECVKESFREEGILDPSSEAINAVTDQLNYFPDDKQIFSKNGCKRVHQKVLVYIEKHFSDKSEGHTEL